MTVDPGDRRVVVSRRIKEEFENGKEYYRFHGQALRDPDERWPRPLTNNLEYHATVVFRDSQI